MYRRFPGAASTCRLPARAGRLTDCSGFLKNTPPARHRRGARASFAIIGFDSPPLAPLDSFSKRTSGPPRLDVGDSTIDVVGMAVGWAVCSSRRPSGLRRTRAGARVGNAPVAYAGLPRTVPRGAAVSGLRARSLLHFGCHAFLRFLRVMVLGFAAAWRGVVVGWLVPVLASFGSMRRRF